MTNAQPKQYRISVVICAFNEQEWIGGTLESLLGQVRAPDEIIVVNNASTDNTVDVVTKFAAAHPQLNLRVVNEPQKGLHRARETGWRAATGDIVVATDADITFYPKWLQIYEQEFIKYPDTGAMSGPVRYYDALDFINWMTWFFEKLNQPEGIGRYFTKTYHLNGGNSAYRRDALVAVNGYADKPKGELEDMYMAAHLQEKGFTIRNVANNKVMHTFRRFNKDGWRGYYKYLFNYTAESVYPDHLQDS